MRFVCGDVHVMKLASEMWSAHACGLGHIDMLILALTFIQLVLGSSGINTGKSSDFYVESLPDYIGDDLPTMHAGQIEVGSSLGLGEKSLFFWHIAAEQNSHTTFVWLNGGPGCSSMDGGLLEVGAFRFDAGTGKMYRSTDSWSSFANLLFIDQPFGTGFSDPAETAENGEFVHSLEQAADVVTEFLYKYAEIFPEIRNTKVYIAGESFAGQYIPHVWKSMKKRPEVAHRLDPRGIGLHGVYLISPWIDPAHQYLSQSLYAKQQNLIDSTYFNNLDIFNQLCMSSLEHKVDFDVPQCEEVSQYILENSKGGPSSQQCFNIYDVSQTSPYPSCGSEWPLELPLVTNYLAREDVQRALHVGGNSKWIECSSKVHRAIKSGQISAEFVGSLMSDIPMLIVVGERDYICNYIGLEQFIKNLEWNGEVGFSASQPELTDYGSWQSERNLTFARVVNGSHMLPVDHLELSGMLARRFVGIESQQDHSKDPPSTDPSTDPSPPPADAPAPDDEAINRAVYRAYRKAGVVALIVVLVVFAVLGAVWWRRGQGLSGKGLLKALLHLGKQPENKREESIPLHRMGQRRATRQRPDVIPEAVEEEEEDREDQYYV